MLPYHGTALVNSCRSLQQMVLLDPVSEHAATTTPLFRWSSGRPLKGQEMHEWVKLMMQRIGERPTDYGTHSLRVGGATSLADAGCPDRLIQTIGRWSSDCYRLYYRESFSEVLRWVTVMESALSRWWASGAE